MKQDEDDDDDDNDDNSGNVMAILAQSKDLAAHPKHREQMIKDATLLGGLVLLLSDKNPQVVEHTLEIFLLLSKSKVGGHARVYGRARIVLSVTFQQGQVGQ